MQSYPAFNPSHALIFAPFVVLVAVAGVVIGLIPYWFIFKKAGFSPWMTLLMVVPLVNIVALYFLAFSQWKVVPVTYGYPAVNLPPPPQP